MLCALATICRLGVDRPVEAGDVIAADGEDVHAAPACLPREVNLFVGVQDIRRQQIAGVLFPLRHAILRDDVAEFDIEARDGGDAVVLLLAEGTTRPERSAWRKRATGQRYRGVRRVDRYERAKIACAALHPRVEDAQILVDDGLCVVRAHLRHWLCRHRPGLIGHTDKNARDQRDDHKNSKQTAAGCT